MASGGTTKEDSATGKGVAKAVEGFQMETSPLRSETLGQILEALKTGGVGAQIPMIQSAVSGSQRATSAALRGTSDSLAGANLTGTPFGQRTLAEAGLAGRQQTAAIPTQMAGQIAGAAPQISMGAIDAILRGLSSVGSSTSRGRQGGVLS